jgi:DNA-binding SARP family transcriptional activator/tetratricopeptide (TPR) repeat protein
MAAPIYITTFGQYRIGSTPASTVDRNAAGVLAYLITASSPVPRTRLFDLLWDTRRIANPSHSLSQALYVLRRLIPGGVASTRDGLSMNPVAIVSDYEQLSAALSSGQDAIALSLYEGMFLNGFKYISDDYDDWKLNVALRVHDDVLHARWRQIRHYEAIEEHGLAAQLALDGLRLDPLDSSLARIRLLSLVELGERDQAVVELRRYQREHALEEGSVPQQLLELEDLIAHHNVAAGPPVPLATALVGRGRETAILEDLWQAVRTGSRTALVSGEAGIGKTRVLQHLMRRIAISGARIFYHQASEGVASLPYSTLAGLMQDGYRRRDEDVLDPPVTSALSALNSDLPAAGRNSSTISNAALLTEPIASYIKIVASRTPLAICVDNLQWVDESSRSTLTYLSQRLADCPILFMYAARDRAIELPVFEDRYLQTTRIELNELNKDDVKALVDSYAERQGQINIPELSTSLYDKLGGRPFFIIEALRILSSTPVARRAEWYSQLVRSPVFIQHFADRLAHMPPVAALLAKTAALVNRPVTLEFLSEIVDAPTIEATQAASYLVATGIFNTGRDIQFAHNLIREAIVRQVPAYEAALWHARIAKKLLSQATGLQEVAAHFERAGYMSEAYQYALKAAKAAGTAKAYREEEEQYHRMLRCAPADCHRDALYTLTRHWVRTGQYLKLEPYLDRLRSALHMCPDGEIEVACAVADLELDELLNRGSSTHLADSAKKVIELAARAGPGVLAQTIWHVAEHCRRSKQFRLMEQVAETLAYHASRLDGKSKVEATAAAALLIASCRGFKDAIRSADVAVRLAEDTNDELIISRAKFARGTVRLWSGHLLAARQDYENVIQVADRIGSTQVVLAARANLSVVMAEQADFNAAIRHANQCLLEGRARQRAFAYGNLALIHLRQSDYDAVRHYAAALLECNRTAPEAWIPAHAAGFIGLVELQSGNLDEAKKHAAFVTARLHVADGAGDVSHLHILRARVDALSGRIGSALNLLSAAAGAAESTDYIAARRLQLEHISLQDERSPVSQNALKGIAAEARCRGAFLLLSEAEAVTACS